MPLTRNFQIGRRRPGNGPAQQAPLGVEVDPANTYIRRKVKRSDRICNQKVKCFALPVGKFGPGRKTAKFMPTDA